MAELKHYGIIGQRWGIRRFQNEDGTLTPLGKRMKEAGSSKRFVSVKETSKDVYVRGKKVYSKGDLVEKNTRNISGVKRTIYENPFYVKTPMTQEKKDAIAKGLKTTGIVLGTIGALVAADLIVSKVANEPSIVDIGKVGVSALLKKPLFL